MVSAKVNFSDVGLNESGENASLAVMFHMFGRGSFGHKNVSSTNSKR